MSDGLRIFLVILLVLGNGWFVLVEYALVTARRPRLQEMKKQGVRGAGSALRLMDEPTRFISTLQIGITVLSILLGAIGEPLISHYFEPYVGRTWSFVIAFVILSYLGLVFGELIPKAWALQRSERIASLFAPFVDFLQKASHPLVIVVQGSAKFVLRLFGMKSARIGGMIGSEAELRSMLAEAEETGVIEEARGGDALQGLRLRREGGPRRHGPAARGRRCRGRAAGGGVPGGDHRLALHPLSGVPWDRSTRSSASFTSAISSRRSTRTVSRTS